MVDLEGETGIIGSFKEFLDFSQCNHILFYNISDMEGLR